MGWRDEPKRCFRTDVAIGAVWTFFYAAGVLIAQRVVFGFSGRETFLAVLVCSIAVGGYGVFLTKVCRDVYGAHPIQTTLYVALLNGVFLTLGALVIFGLVALPSLFEYGGDPTGLLLVNAFGAIGVLAPAAAASSVFSLPLTQVLARRQ